MLKFYILILLIFSNATNAVIIGPTIHEQDDFGDVRNEQFTYSLSVECEEGIIHAIIMDGQLNRVEEANTYLKYYDFSSPLISTDKSNNSGRVRHKLPGNVSLMRGLFSLIIEKDGYRTKEVHFDIIECLANTSYVPPPPVITPPPPSPPPSQPAPAYPQDIINETTEENETEEIVNITDEITDNDTIISDEEEDAKLCPIAFLFPLLTIFAVCWSKPERLSILK